MLSKTSTEKYDWERQLWNMGKELRVKYIA